MSSIPLHVVPAYGADYKTEAEALAAWSSGKDFKIMDIYSTWNGAYCSCRDFTRAESVLIRFNKRANFVITGGLAAASRRPKHGGSVL